MQIVARLDQLAPNAAYWVPAVAAPVRDWSAVPGCRRGARFLIDGTTFAPARSGFPAFDSRSECLRWIMEHRIALAGAAPGAAVTAARLDAWMLGLDAV